MFLIGKEGNRRAPCRTRTGSDSEALNPTMLQPHFIKRAGLRDVWNLPPEAVREAIVNAVVHADYAQRGAPIRVALFEDRLEVENPGLLPFGLTLAGGPARDRRMDRRVTGRWTGG